MEEGKKKKVELPNFYAPMYVEYIWKDHAPNFTKYIDELDSGDNEVRFEAFFKFFFVNKFFDSIF